MKSETEIEIQFDDLTAKITTTPAAIFRIIRALNEDGREVTVRYYDEELKDHTCWQPTKKAA